MMWWALALTVDPPGSGRQLDELVSPTSELPVVIYGKV